MKLRASKKLALSVLVGMIKLVDRRNECLSLDNDFYIV